MNRRHFLGWVGRLGILSALPIPTKWLAEKGLESTPQPASSKSWYMRGHAAEIYIDGQRFDGGDFTVTWEDEVTGGQDAFAFGDCLFTTITWHFIETPDGRWFTEAPRTLTKHRR